MHNDALRNGLWFDPRSLEKQSDSGAWSRGLALYRSNKVLDMAIQPAGDHWVVSGEVQGSQRTPYELCIDMALAADGKLAYWDCDCDCPVGDNCKHGVALMLKAAYQGAPWLARAVAGGTQAVAPAKAPDPPSPAQREAARIAALAQATELAQRQAEAKLLHWLQEMDRANGLAPAPEPGAPGSLRPRGSNLPDQYIYIVTVHGAQSPKPLLNLEAVVAYPKVSGGWSKPKPIKTPPYPGQAVFDTATPTDRQILQLLRVMPSSQNYRYAYTFSANALLEGAAGMIALEQAASTGRLFMDDGKGYAGTPLQWGPTHTLGWHWQEVINPHEPAGEPGSEPGWALRGKLADPRNKLCLNSPPLYINETTGLCGPVHAEGIPGAQLDVLLKAPPLKPSALKKHQAELVQRLGSVPLPPVLGDLTTLRGMAPRALLHLAPTAQSDVADVGLIEATLRYDYAGHTGWWAGQGVSVLLETEQGRVLLQRDAEAEFDFVSRLFDTGLAGGEGGLFGLPGHAPQHAWFQWAESGFAVFKELGFEVTLGDGLKDWIVHADGLDVTLQPQGAAKGAGRAQTDALHDGDPATTSPWFDLSLGMEINGQRHNILPLLPSLIATAARSPLNAETGLPELPPYVYLPYQRDDLNAQDGWTAGSSAQLKGGARRAEDTEQSAQPSNRLSDRGAPGFIRLPTDTLRPWMAALLELVGDRTFDFTADTLKLSRLDAMRTTASLGEGAVWEGALALREMVQGLSGRTALPEVAVPTSVNATLRPYQQQGLNWLQFLRAHGLGGILADDMGLGKTLQTLAHIQVEKDAGRLTHPALIIAPVSLMGNWRKEVERFCPGLRTLVIHGKDRHEVADSMAEHDIVIAPYSLLQRDKDRWLEAQWHIVVLDEAQNIKNATTHAAQVVGQLNTAHRLCLSGTPMENHLGEIWSLFHFLMPGFLGSQKRFGELFRTPIEKQGDSERLQQLRARITPFMLRRTKALVASELPPKVETIQRVALTGKQADLYETIRLGMEKTVREALSSKGLAKSQITILDALLKLRQVCCDPQLLKLPAAQKVKTSAKLEHLMELLPEMVAEGRHILLFSQFTTMLTLIEAELKAHGITWVKLTGASQNRDALIEQFTSGQVPVFLISLKAGGVGLNLPQADTVIHYDPWWNPAAENQATDRAHRIGQTHTVFVHKLVAQGTIEERILDLQARKAALAEGMYSGSTGRKEPLFTEGDVAELLRPLSDT